MTVVRKLPHVATTRADELAPGDIIFFRRSVSLCVGKVPVTPTSWWINLTFVTSHGTVITTRVITDHLFGVLISCAV